MHTYACTHTHTSDALWICLKIHTDEHTVKQQEKTDSPRSYFPPEVVFVTSTLKFFFMSMYNGLELARSKSVRTESFHTLQKTDPGALNRPLWIKPMMSPFLWAAPLLRELLHNIANHPWISSLTSQFARVGSLGITFPGGSGLGSCDQPGSWCRGYCRTCF